MALQFVVILTFFVPGLKFNNGILIYGESASADLNLKPISKDQCPQECLCFEFTVRCMFLEITSVPKNLPKQTKVM